MKVTSRAQGYIAVPWFFIVYFVNIWYLSSLSLACFSRNTWISQDIWHFAPQSFSMYFPITRMFSLHSYRMWLCRKWSTEVHIHQFLWMLCPTLSNQGRWHCIQLFCLFSFLVYSSASFFYYFSFMTLTFLKISVL